MIVRPDVYLVDAVKNPATALEAIVETWVAAYAANDESRGKALAELINFVIRVSQNKLRVTEKRTNSELLVLRVQSVHRQPPGRRFGRNRQQSR